MKRTFLLSRTVSAVLALLLCISNVQAQIPRSLSVVKRDPLVIGETFLMTSRTLGERRRINVYLPPGYRADSTRNFPVLYMPDGGLSEDFLHVAGLVEVSVGNMTMRPFILVGIENTERRRDMTGPTTVDADKKIAIHVGGSAAFRTFLKTELIPLVRKQYRTTSESAIVGESLAGLFVVETFLVEPALFDTYIAFDPSLWWNNGEMVRTAAELLATRSLQGKTLYVASSGDAGLEPAIKQLAANLDSMGKRGMRWMYEPLPHETHATIYHPAALQAFRALFMPP